MFIFIYYINLYKYLNIYKCIQNIYVFTYYPHLYIIRIILYIYINEKFCVLDIYKCGCVFVNLVYVHLYLVTEFKLSKTNLV